MHRQRGGVNQRRMGAAGGADAAAGKSQPEEEGLACAGGGKSVCWREDLRKAMKVGVSTELRLSETR